MCDFSWDWACSPALHPLSCSLKRGPPPVPPPRSHKPESSAQPAPTSPPSCPSLPPASPPTSQSEAAPALTNRLRQRLSEGRLLGNKPQAPCSAKGRLEGASEDDESVSLSVSGEHSAVRPQDLRRERPMAFRRERPQRDRGPRARSDGGTAAAAENGGTTEAGAEAGTA